MKMKKLLSIGAIALTIASCTTIGASAAEVANGTEGNKQRQYQMLTTNALDGVNVLNGISINASTKLGNYLTDGALKEAQDTLQEAGINVAVTSNDTYYTIQNKIAAKFKGYDKDTKNAKFAALKEKVTNKLDEKVNDYRDLSNEALASKAAEYVKVARYGKVVVGTNMDQNRTVALIDYDGNVVLQVNSESLRKAKDRVAGVEDIDQLLKVANQYYPNAENYYNSVLAESK